MTPRESGLAARRARKIFLNLFEVDHPPARALGKSQSLKVTWVSDSNPDPDALLKAVAMLFRDDRSTLQQMLSTGDIDNANSHATV